jgi:hypothetical protein
MLPSQPSGGVVASRIDRRDEAASTVRHRYDPRCDPDLPVGADMEDNKAKTCANWIRILRHVGTIS